jgi:arylsulfatase A-like enzyme|tara:strand:- start:15 stop:1751 length:1737 start_codon:yes stop_codon:yes gene_type:complete
MSPNSFLILAISYLVFAVGKVCLSDEPKPNVILIMTDDQGYGELSSHGHAILKTPNLDRLRDESVRLTDFHVSSKCSPTRGALMTGRHCRHVGVREADNGRNIIGREFSTIADIFSENGYKTGIFGKWHLGGHYPFRPQDRGFDEVVIHTNGAIGTTGDRWDNDYYDDLFWHNGKLQRYNGYCTDIWFEEAMAWMKQSTEKKQPFFCYLPTNAPHGPYIVPDKYSEPYRKAGRTDANRLGMISNIDENMGKLMAFLDSTGLQQNTILIFLTDNGAPQRIGDNAGMRGGKGNGYDGGHRVPFLIRWPDGSITGRKDVDTLTAHIDVLPSLVELCGLSPDGTQFDGISFASLLRGKQDSHFDNRVLIESYSGVVLTEEWRLVNNEELHNIQTDPAQERNVADEYPELVSKFRKVLDTNRAADFHVVPRIIIGSDFQPEQEFTIYHWYDHHGYYNNLKVTQGQLINGVIPIEVTKPGKFEFTLRRWPSDLDIPISSKPDNDLDGFKLFNASDPTHRFKAIDIRSARLRVGLFDKSSPVSKTTSSVVFSLDLKAGETEIETWFTTANGKTLGAYYLDVRRIN